MPLMFIPPVVVGTLGVIGVVVLAKVLAREWRRVNAELHPPETVDQDPVGKLRRDPKTGIYRPE